MPLRAVRRSTRPMPITLLLSSGYVIHFCFRPKVKSITDL
jgi:hypothetical protein